MAATDELAALHELAKSCPGGVEGCAWWLGCVDFDSIDCWYTNSYGNSEVIDPQHALDLVERHAERWLVAKGWNLTRLAGEKGYTYHPPGGVLRHHIPRYTLPDALKHAMDAGEEKEKTPSDPPSADHLPRPAQADLRHDGGGCGNTGASS